MEFPIPLRLYHEKLFHTSKSYLTRVTMNSQTDAKLPEPCFCIKKYTIERGKIYFKFDSTHVCIDLMLCVSPWFCAFCGLNNSKWVVALMVNV
jgi:hypothetical protein